MTPADAPQKLRKTPIFTAYEVVWSALGALSLGILMVLALAPEWLDDLRPASMTADPQSNQGQRAAARLAADVNALKQSVAQVQMELAKVKTDVTTQVSALETRLGSAALPPQIEAAAGPAPAAQPQAPVQPPVETLRAYVTPKETTAAAAPEAAAPAAEASAEPAPAPPHAPKVINADATVISTSLTTGTVSESGNVPANAPATTAATDAISFGPAVVKHAPKPLGIKLSSGASVDSLRLSWSLLADKHGDTLKSLQAHFVTSGDAQNPNFDLVAGPIKSKAQANKVCKDLAAKGVPCTVGAFNGEAL
jgi:hypothetical protein